MQDKSTAIVLLRITLGLNLLTHGLVRFFGSYSGFVEKITKDFQGLLPEFALGIFAWALPPVEAILGLLLILGLFTRFALISGAIVMMVLVFGTSLKQNWDTVSSQMLYALIYFFLIRNLSYNRFALDNLWNPAPKLDDVP